MAISTKSTLKIAASNVDFIPPGMSYKVSGADATAAMRLQHKYYFVDNGAFTLALNREVSGVLNQSEATEYFNTYKSFLLGNGHILGEHVVNDFQRTNIKSDEKVLERAIKIPAATTEKILYMETAANGTMIISEVRQLGTDGFFAIGQILRFGRTGVTDFTFTSLAPTDTIRKYSTILWTQQDAVHDNVFGRPHFNVQKNVWYIPVVNTAIMYKLDMANFQLTSYGTSVQMGSYHKFFMQSIRTDSYSSVSGVRFYSTNTVWNHTCFYWKGFDWTLVNNNSANSYLARLDAADEGNLIDRYCPHNRVDLIAFLVDYDYRGTRLLSVGYDGANYQHISVYELVTPTGTWNRLGYFIGAGLPGPWVTDPTVGARSYMDCQTLEYTATGTEIGLANSPRGFNYHPHGQVILRNGRISFGYKMDFYGEPGIGQSVIDVNGTAIQTRDNLVKMFSGEIRGFNYTVLREKFSGLATLATGSQSSVYVGYVYVYQRYPIRSASRTYLNFDLVVTYPGATNAQYNITDQPNDGVAREIEQVMVSYDRFVDLAQVNFNVGSPWGNYTDYLVLANLMTLSATEKAALTVNAYIGDKDNSIVRWIPGPADDTAAVAINFTTEQWVFVGGVDLRNAITKMTIPKIPHYYAQAGGMQFTTT